MKVTDMTCRQYTIQSMREFVPSAVGSVVEFIEGETRLSGCNCIHDIKVVLSELLINAIVHGNEDKSEKPVDIYVDIESNIILIRITDRGPSFKPDKDRKEDILSECGRGINICHILCGTLEYSFEEGKGNSATAVFYIKE
ncbi:MAG: ATP-binding protein [Clostridia bacterium]|nr:ATP-binding protein [Clostridia bacterium]